MVICLERDADLHMAHSLSLASVKSRLVLPFWYRLTRVVLDKGPLNACVCVCVCVIGEQPDRHQFVVFITFGSMQMTSVTEVIEHSEIMCSFYACLPQSRRKSLPQLSM